MRYIGLQAARIAFLRKIEELRARYAPKGPPKTEEWRRQKITLSGRGR